MCENRKEFSIVRMVKVLNVSISGYYKWMSRINMPPNERELENIKLLEEIINASKDLCERMGSFQGHIENIGLRQIQNTTI